MDLISQPRLLEETFVRQVCWMKETGSTNSEALEQAAQEGPLPALFGADLQIQGRGRNQHVWWADTGALTFSLLLRPASYGIPPRSWPLLSLATGLAVCRTLEELLPGESVQVKWPNDVYVRGKKNCGILLETTPDKPDLLVVGIGVNVNNSLSRAPDELKQTAIALCDLSGRELDRNDVLIPLLQTYQRELQALGQDSSQVIRACRERCFLTGRMMTVQDVVCRHSGMCLGIDDDGALRIMTEAGPQRLFAGEILSFD